MDSNLEVLIESFKQNHPINENNKVDSIFYSLQYLSQLEQFTESSTTVTEQSYTKLRTKQAINVIQESIKKENTLPIKAKYNPKIKNKGCIVNFKLAIKFRFR